MATKLKFGLLLPHFCEYGSTELCIEGSKKADSIKALTDLDSLLEGHRP